MKCKVCSAETSDSGACPGCGYRNETLRVYSLLFFQSTNEYALKAFLAGLAAFAMNLILIFCLLITPLFGITIMMPYLYLSFLLPLFCIIFGVVSIISGMIGINDYNEQPSIGGKTEAWAGIALGVVSSGIWGLLLALVTIAAIFG